MRIALFTEVFLPKVDGIVNTLCRLLDYLDRNGHESLLVAPRPALQHYARTRILAIPSTSLPFYPELHLASPFYPIDPGLEAFHPDLVHIINPIALGLVGLRYAHKDRLPLVASYHTDLPGFANRWGFGFFNEGLWSYLRFIHNQADMNLCPSQATFDELNRHGFTNLKVWSRGVDTEVFHPRRESQDWRWRLSGGKPDRPLLLFAGRLSAEKRVDWLADVLKAVPEANLAIVGDGPQRGALEEKFAGLPAVFTGYLKSHDLAAAYASSDVFVFPAANETFGNVVLEAMASGLPVITPGSGGPLDFVDPGHNGLLFETERVDSLISCVRQLIFDSQMARALGRAGRSFAEKRNWDHIFDRLMLDYHQIIDRRRSVLSGIGRPRVSKLIRG